MARSTTSSPIGHATTRCLYRTMCAVQWVAGSKAHVPKAFPARGATRVCQFACRGGWSSLVPYFRGLTVEGLFENVANLTAPIRDVLLLILGAIVSLVGTLIVQNRRAKDELRLKIQATTVTRLAKLEDLVARIVTQLGWDANLPLMVVAGKSPLWPSPQSEELDSAAEELTVLAHSFRRFPFLTSFIGQLVEVVRKLLSEPLMASDVQPEVRMRDLLDLQKEISHLTRVIDRVVDQINATHLRTDLTWHLRIKRFWGRLTSWLRKQR